MDGNRRVYPVTPYTTVKVLTKQICLDQGILWHEAFALYERAGKVPQDLADVLILERFLDPAMRVSDIIAKWECADEVASTSN